MKGVIFVRLLQINNTGVVPYVITEYLRREHSDSIHVDLIVPMHGKRDEQFQRGLKDVITLPANPTVLQQYIDNNIKDYDVVHVHALYQHIPQIKKRNPDIKIVYTGHGREVRNSWHPLIQELSDYVTCATKDLWVKGVDYVPNVPDPYHWVRKREAIKNKALMKKFSDAMVDDVKSYEEAYSISVINGLNLDVQDRGRGMYSYMNYPRFLEVYDTFFDFKYITKGIGLDSWELPLSYTALQFLQLGGTVYHQSGIYDKLPPYMDYDRVMKGWVDIYEGILE